ncbi:hypothetical protein SAMN05421788_11842 [Filimonas lacunae]|uniref:Uncharacterized protein n=1 Tax=Filimonas lacunae TaxID=477680 RepID=A0A173MBC5_9BACT|nr:hypothetical protein [Filimonas lacunae]BAV04837.1 hypothetical protein FLA_0837 [Filimonas lacunae]SIT34687.1 hypothetical protein SAMN05421788_11842 [Filimonas lacunae]
MFFFKKKQAPATLAADYTDNDTRLQEAIRLDNPEQLFPWATFEELEKQPYVKKQPIDFPNPNFKGLHYFIKKPVQLFGIIIPEVTIATPSWESPNVFNPHWPVSRLTAEVRFASPGWDTYQQIKTHFINLWGDPDSIFENDTSEYASASCQWQQQKISVKISIWKPDQSNKFRKDCWLEVEQQPDLSAFLSDDYQQSLTLHPLLQYTIQEGTFTTGGTYIDKSTLKNTPDCIAQLLTNDNSFIVWRDKEHNKVGFANKKLCHILPLQSNSVLRFRGYFFRDSPIDCGIYYGAGKTYDNTAYIGKLTNAEESTWATIRKDIATLLECDNEYWEDKQYT